MTTEVAIAAGIFARGGSKGLPGKNLRIVAGKSLLVRAIETARAVPGIARLFVSTDDALIAAVAEANGVEVPFMRPKHLAGDQVAEWASWQHAVRALSTQAKIDVLLVIPTTAPVRHTEDVVGCLDLLLKTGDDVSFAVTPAHRNPYFNMVTLTPAGRAQLALRGDRAVVTRQSAPPMYDMTTIAYAVRTDFLLAAESWLEGRARALVVPVERSLDIDTEFDLRIAEYLMDGRE
jgi:N-acylneuraminate cytidylyltransferase